VPPKPDERIENALPDGPGLARRWLVATQLMTVGLLAPIVLADVLSGWQNWASRRSASVSEVVGQFAPGVAIWSGFALVAGLVAIAVSRFEVTAWPKICLLTMLPSLVAFVAIGAGSGLASDNRAYLLFLLDIPLVAGLAAAGYLLVRAGVHRLIEPAGKDTIATGLDVRVPLREGASLLLRHDRMVIIEDGRREAISWYDYRTARASRDAEPGVEIIAVNGRRLILADPARVRPVLGAIIGRMRLVRARPAYLARRDDHRRVGDGRRQADTVKAAHSLDSGVAVGRSIGSLGLVVLFMVTMPVATVVLLVASVNAPVGQRPGLAVGAVAAALIGIWAHVKFWRRRAARRWLETHSER
jgi:hypothetical protein